MKKSTLFLAVFVSCFVASIAISDAAGAFKIGIIDFQKILTSSSPGKLATEEMNKKGKTMEEDVKAKEAELMELQKKLERESLVMGKDKSEEKQRELRIKVNDFKGLKANYVKAFKKIQAQYFNKIKNEVLDLTIKIGKKEGFSLIMERNEGGIMYLDDAIDITDKVIKQYNKTAVIK